MFHSPSETASLISGGLYILMSQEIK